MQFFSRKKKRETVDDLVREIENGADLSLSGLDSLADLPKVELTEEEEWMSLVFRDMGFDNFYWESINRAIYTGRKPGWYMGSGPSYDQICKDWEVRMHKLYGNRYAELREHSFKDESVKKLLLEDAMKTGKWKQLPKELWLEYHERIGVKEPWKIKK